MPATTTSPDTFTLLGILVDDSFVTLEIRYGSYEGARVFDTYGRLIAEGTATEQRFDGVTLWSVPDIDRRFGDLVVETTP